MCVYGFILLVHCSCISRHIEKALELVHDPADKVEARLMLASISKDMNDWISVHRNCKSKTHLVGEIECFEILVREKPSALTDKIAQHFIPTLEAIFKLLAAFAKPTNNAEKNWIQDCFRFYGLVVCIFCYL